jgi:large subunit ribosomal protein L4
MVTNLYDKKGKKTEKKVKLESGIFDLKVNQDLLTRVIYLYLNNQRQANAQAKDRSEVSGGGKKPWKQKGTGRARHGSNRSPIWKGGGVTFGPTNDRNYKGKLNRKVKGLAIKNALSVKSQAKEVIVIEDFKPEKTKDLETALKNLGIKGRITFIQVNEEGLYKCAKNIKDVDVVRVGELNAYNILDNKTLVILESALDNINNLWGKK